MSREYYTSLVNDFVAMGLIDRYTFVLTQKHDDEPVVASYDELTDLVSVIEPSEGMPAEITPVTAFAKSVYKLPRETSFRKVGWACCADAESKLRQNLQEDEVTNPRLRPPLLVTQNETVVGVIKQRGERTGYALATNHRMGLIKGTFFSPVHRAEQRAIVTVPNSERPYKIDVGELPAIIPVRFSSLCVPLRERRGLSWGHPDDIATLRTSHQQIRQRAAELLSQAIPFSL